ncbi:RidA family protein [Paracoccus aestuarii]|uniref:RidA family protein n=1 Tax=Paracoccus aestuarii TaxID=453842 RepID=A0A419A109_9RHOB|nr:RidA family protein [Paracoccus aestuarii]RJL06515.1 RidA family protein [Paracoccus aestuarii]WCQ98821.1 RidA family protein [Paracoccus aestuarii]
MSIEQTLADKGITLPEAPMPAANYVPFVQTGNLVFISGQISADENGLITGKLGDGTSVEDGAAAARRCGLALIAQLKSAVGDLDRVTRVVKLTGFVNSTPDFTDQPKVINGCSDLMVEVFGDAGRHARAAVSAPSLPFGVAVEIEAVFEVR